MAGNSAGGMAAAATNKLLYGDRFYAEIGAIGGSRGRTGGFFANRELARIAGSLGGSISSRSRERRYRLTSVEKRKLRDKFEQNYARLMAVHMEANRISS